MHSILLHTHGFNKVSSLRQVTSICHPDFHLRLSTPLSPSSVGPSPNSHLVAVQLRGSRLIKLSSYLMHLLILHFNPHPLRALYLRQPPNHKMQSSSPHFTVHTRHSHAPIASLHRPHSHAHMLPSHLRVWMPGTVHTRHSHAPIGDTPHAPISSHPLVTHMLPCSHRSLRTKRPLAIRSRRVAGRRSWNQA